MANETFQPGDVVELKSGSHGLTVVQSGEQTTTCYYYNQASNEFKEVDIPTIALQKVSQKHPAKSPGNYFQK